MSSHVDGMLATGDGTITVRVNSLETTHVWAKAGVMFRESLGARSKHVMAIVSPRKGVAVQYRAGTGGFSENAAIATGTAPEWLRLVRAGDTFTGFASEDGTIWRTLGSVTVPMASSVLVGRPVTSHDNTTLATATFSDPVIALQHCPTNRWQAEGMRQLAVGVGGSD